MGRPVQWLGYVMVDPEFESRYEQELYVFNKTSKPAHRPIQSVPWTLSTEVTQSAREANHSPLYSAKAKN
jgi:hypothetical protein